MRPTIDHGVTPQSASVKFPHVGGFVVGSLVSVSEFQSTDFATKKPLTWPDGRPQMTKHVKLVMTRCDNVSVEADPYEVVSVYLSGGRLIDYNASVRQYMADNDGAVPLVGSMVEVKYTHDEPSQTKGFAPRKMLSYRFRPETAGDKRAADLAEEAYNAAQPEPAARPVASYNDRVEDPF